MSYLNYPRCGCALRVERRPAPGPHVLTLHGELDLATRPALDGELLEAQSAGATELVVDLSQLDFMDGAGLHALLDAHARAQALGHQFSLVRGPRAVQRLFELTGTERIFGFEGSDEGLQRPASERGRWRCVRLPEFSFGPARARVW